MKTLAYKLLKPIDNAIFKLANKLSNKPKTADPYLNPHNYTNGRIK